MSDYVDETTPEVLAELGRLTLAAIYLEDFTRSLIWLLVPRPRGALDGAPIGNRISAAIDAVAQIEDPHVAEQARRYLEGAKAALAARNEVLHSIPVTVEPLPGTTPIEGTHGQFLHHIPNSSTRRQKATPLTVDGLCFVTEQLLRARASWRETYIAVAGDRDASRADGQER